MRCVHDVKCNISEHCLRNIDASNGWDFMGLSSCLCSLRNSSARNGLQSRCLSFVCFLIRPIVLGFLDLTTGVRKIVEAGSNLLSLLSEAV